jgi:hypothetical protein
MKHPFNALLLAAATSSMMIKPSPSRSPARHPGTGGVLRGNPSIGSSPEAIWSIVNSSSTVTESELSQSPTQRSDDSSTHLPMSGRQTRPLRHRLPELQQGPFAKPQGVGVGVNDGFGVDDRVGMDDGVRVGDETDGGGPIVKVGVAVGGVGMKGVPLGVGVASARRTARAK